MSAAPVSEPALAPAARCPMRGVLGWVALPVRVALGGLLVLSGFMKLGLTSQIWWPGSGLVATLSPLDFAFAIKGFKMGLPDEAVAVLAFVVPWMELLAGLTVLLGAWARAGAALTATLMIAFSAGIVGVLTRPGIDVNCPCFGSLKLFCSGRISGCHLVRNSAFLAAALLVLTAGPGPLSVDAWRARLARTGRAA